MRTLLLTGFDQAMQPLGDLTSPIMLAYSSKSGFDFQCIRNYPEDIPAYWHKISVIVQAFDAGYDRVFWLDADQVITNPRFYPSWCIGFHAPMDWGTDATDDSCFSMCAILACKETRFLFQWVLDHEIEFIDQDFPEQTAMRHLYQTSKRARSLMRIHPRKVFNCVPKEVCQEAPEPWERGDFACHITHVPIRERVKIFHQIQEQMENGHFEEAVQS